MKLSVLLLNIGFILYAIQGPLIYPYIAIASLFFLLASIANSIKIPKVISFIIFLIIPFFILGILNNDSITDLYVDLKIWGFWLVTFWIGILILKKFNIDTIIKSLSYAIFLIFAIYLYLSVSSSNPYINREIPEYANYRTAGPYLIPLLIFQLLHLLTNLPKDKFYWFYTIISILTMVINGGLQNLVILIIGVILNNAPIFFKIKGIKYYIILIPIALAISQYIPDKQANKISELANPLNSQTVLTRISDLTYMLTYNKNKSSLIGDGFGVRSNVFRIVNGQ
jgi:hypothetical protein